ncbi:MAG: IS110 family transposase [Spirochaetia bacterium]|nr:IS110 family transposase [Spirochaetia bacterium]
MLESMVAEDKDVESLQTIPGVGLITAATLGVFIDDIDRYESPKKFAAHMGLAPWVQNSNGMIPSRAY